MEKQLSSVMTGLTLQRSGLQASNNVALIFIYEVLVLGTPCFGFQAGRFMMELVHEETWSMKRDLLDANGLKLEVIAAKT